MFKLTGKVPPYNLYEVGQKNPLRWILVKRDGDDLIPQTAEFKCKDYLNDIVAKYHGHEITVYGFNTKEISLNEEGCYFILKHVVDKDVIIHNIETVINKEVAEENRITIWNLDNDLLILVPRFFFTSTYLISLASYLIRISNGTEKFKDFDSVWDTVSRRADTAISSDAQKLPKKWKFNIPDSHKAYWYYNSKDYNSVTKPAFDGYGGTIHNCGVCTWNYGVK